MTQRKSKRQPGQADGLSIRMWPLFAAALILAGLLVTFQTLHQRKHARQPVGPAEQTVSPAQSTPTPPMSEQALKDTVWDPQWPPLPHAGTPAKPLDEVRAMYAFAARHPDALQYAPCYCSCESGGHESVRDCFVKGRTADGKPQWDGMGFI
jgi:hypothetical protein